MSDLEELKKRKEQLLLEQEVAHLERKQKFDATGRWSWKWVGPLAAVGLFFLAMGLDGSDSESRLALVLAFFVLIPVALKLFFKR